MSLGYNVRQHDTGGYIYVLLGAEREVETRAVFEALHAQRHEIETAYGGLLEWNPPEGRKSFGVTYRLEEGGWRDRERWPEVLPPHYPGDQAILVSSRASCQDCTLLIG